MAKHEIVEAEPELYKVLKAFAYTEGNKVITIRKFLKNKDNQYIVDEKKLKKPNILALTGEALRVGKKCKAIEWYTEEEDS